MFRVSDFMTPNPITVEPSETISDAIELMKINHIHRVPVVDSKDHLKGLITEGMITGADKGPTSLSIYELNYLLSKTQVKSVMEKHPFVINQKALIEEAAALLLAEDIGCLPVVDDENKVVGILTQNDIFKSFLELLGWEYAGTRLVLDLVDEVGVLERLTDLFSENNINIRNISVYDHQDGNSKVILKTEPALSDEFVEKIKEAGFVVEEAINVEAV